MGSRMIVGSVIIQLDKAQLEAELEQLLLRLAGLVTNLSPQGDV
jgi:hypothetical protein